MTSYKKYFAVTLMSAALALPAAGAHARGTSNQTKATLAGAAVGAALTGALGGNGQNMLLGAAAGGLAGNAYAYHNKKMNQKDEEARRYRYRHYDRYDHYGDRAYPPPPHPHHVAYKKPKKHKKHKKHHHDWDDWDD